ncbi:uncharacterized protein LOC143434970 isoform X5 [Arvicanthis niloticus]|uniref:uncharacterized protein LOC143309302 isoform X2 n=1 Tax=Arvicanthis niloticus TaxID=61156 RepID=UPI00402B76D8
MCRIRGHFHSARGQARPVEVNGRPSRDCKGRDVWLEVNGRHKGSKADNVARSVIWLLKALWLAAARVELCTGVCIPTQFRLVPFAPYSLRPSTVRSLAVLNPPGKKRLRPDFCKKISCNRTRFDKRIIILHQLLPANPSYKGLLGN